MITRVKIKGLYVWLELKSSDDNSYHCIYYFQEPGPSTTGYPVLGKDAKAAKFSDLQTALDMGISVTERRIKYITQGAGSIVGNRYN
jgi:hypothetical protein